MNSNSEKQEVMVNLTVYTCQIPVQAFFDRINTQLLQNSLLQNVSSSSSSSISGLSHSIPAITNANPGNDEQRCGGGGGGGGDQREIDVGENEKKKRKILESQTTNKSKQIKKENNLPQVPRYVKASWFHRLNDTEQPVDCLLCKKRITFDNRKTHFDIHFTKFVIDQCNNHNHNADIKRFLEEYLLSKFNTYRQKEIIYEESKKAEFTFLRHQPFLDFMEEKRKKETEIDG